MTLLASRTLPNPRHQRALGLGSSGCLGDLSQQHLRRSPGYFEYQLPVSVKVVIDLAGKVPLLKNERDEWELPGGKLELGETAESTALREVEEELGLEAEQLTDIDIIDSWVYEIFPHRHVFVVSYGAEYSGARTPKVSSEHKELGLFEYHEIAKLKMPDAYKRTIESWWRKRAASTSPPGPAEIGANRDRHPRPRTRTPGAAEARG